MQGRQANEWAIRGLQPNQYYASADAAEVPLELDQDPNDYITFHPTTYKPGPIPPSVFNLPADVRGSCSKSCPLVSTCTIAAVRAWVQQQQQQWLWTGSVAGRRPGGASGVRGAGGRSTDGSAWPTGADSYHRWR